MIWVFLLTTLLAYFFLYAKKKHSYWKERGVSYLKPTFLIGNIELIQKKCMGEKVIEFYNSIPESRYFGIYVFLQPFLFVKDVDLLKQITVKDFDHFVDRRTVTSDEVDPIWSKSLASINGEKWRDVRSTVSPAFTSSKMKMMYSLMEQCAQQFIEYFSDNQSEVQEVEMKDALTRYTNDVIGTAAFGLECNSFKQKNNEFFLMGKETSNMNFLRILRFMSYTISPTLTKLLDIKVVPPHITKYFSKLIEDTVKFREEKNVIRPDMIHLLMEARKGRELQDKEELKVNEGFSSVQESDLVKNAKKQEITLEDIIAQAFFFFFAGFDSIATLLNFTLYELALHPDIQDRLREEIDSVPGKITYEKLLNLKYLDMVVSESLRKWSPGIFTERVVTKPFTIQPEKPDEVPVTLEEGLPIMIPIWAIHRDPQYYPEPEKFDPERFSDENKKQINASAYFPFGTGPRNCIGSRFALLEGKLLLYHVLKNFEVVPVKKTPVPMVLDPKQFGLVAKGGMWLGLKKINK